MPLKSKYIVILFLLPFFCFLFSCTRTIHGYKIQGASKKRALSFNKYSTSSGSKYRHLEFGTRQQQKKSFKFNYGKYNSFGGKNKKSKSFNSVYGSQISFGKGSGHYKNSRSNFGQFISFGGRHRKNSSVNYGKSYTFGKPNKRRLFSSKSHAYGNKISFGRSNRKKNASGKVYGSEIRFGNSKNNSAKHLNDASIGGRHGFFSFNWLRGKHKNLPATNRKKTLQLNLFDPKQKSNSRR